MPRILISASFAADLILRQTPGRSGHWEEFEFVSDAGGEPVDGWVVYDNLREPQVELCPEVNTLLITGEPESLRRYRSRFTSQFAHVWTSHRGIQHRSLTIRNEAQHWHYALYPSSVHATQLSYDDLLNLKRPEKSELISVICSAKAHTDDHRQRLAFVERLREHFGESVHVYGRGVRDMRDKAEAIYNYKYHIVLENDHSSCFMTEKISDAFLGWSYPIYFGGAEAYHRFPEGSFTAIDIYQPDVAINVIENVLASDAYSNSLQAVAEARERVLNTNNICSMLADFWRDHLASEPPTTVRLLPKSHRANLLLMQLQRAVLGRRNAA